MTDQQDLPPLPRPLHNVGLTSAQKYAVRAQIAPLLAEIERYQQWELTVAMERAEWKRERDRLRESLNAIYAQPSVKQVWGNRTVEVIERPRKPE